MTGLALSATVLIPYHPRNRMKEEKIDPAEEHD